MPGSWPTLRGFRDGAAFADAGNRVGETPSGLPRHKMGLGSIQSGVPYSFRRAVLNGFLEDLRTGCAEVDSVADVEDNTGVGERGLVRQRSNGSLTDTDDGISHGQATPDSIEDTDMALPPFPNLINTAGQMDWAKYLLWMEDDMSLEERTNNNMLLVGNSIGEVSSDDVNTHLSLDIKPTGKRGIFLFKDLPAMRQGQHDGLAMYILGYDAAEMVLFVRRFERLSSKIELLPRYWDCGKEVVWSSVGRLLQILRDVDLNDASTSDASVFPEWNEELGFKIVVVAMFAQWVLDFSDGLRMMTEVAEIAHMLLLRWMDSLLWGSAGKTASVPQNAEDMAGQQLLEEVDVTEEQEVVSVSKSLELPLHETRQISNVFHHEISARASPRIDDAAHDRRHTYDSDEEEEWAALQDWAARNKPEQKPEIVNTKPAGEAATSHIDLSSNKVSESNNTSLNLKRAQSPPDTSDLARLSDTKRFSDTSTLCDGGEETKEKVAFANTLRNAMLNEASIEAMLRVYFDFVKEHPEHDSEKKRSDLSEFLVGHVGKNNGGSSSVTTSTLEAAKEMNLVEEKEAAAAGVKMAMSLERPKST